MRRDGIPSRVDLSRIINARPRISSHPSDRHARGEANFSRFLRSRAICRGYLRSHRRGFPFLRETHRRSHCRDYKATYISEINRYAWCIGAISAHGNYAADGDVASRHGVSRAADSSALGFIRDADHAGMHSTRRAFIIALAVRYASGPRSLLGLGYAWSTRVSRFNCTGATATMAAAAAARRLDANARLDS